MFVSEQFPIFSTSNSEFGTTSETNLLEYDDNEMLDLDMLLNTPSPKHLAEDLTIVNYQQGSEYERSEHLAHVNQDEDSVTVNEQGIDQNTHRPENDVAADPAMDEPINAAVNNNLGKGKAKAPLKKLKPRKRKGIDQSTLMPENDVAADPGKVSNSTNKRRRKGGVAKISDEERRARESKLDQVLVLLIQHLQRGIAENTPAGQSDEVIEELRKLRDCLRSQKNRDKKKDELKELQNKCETQKTDNQDLLHKYEELQDEWKELQNTCETQKTNYQDLHRKYEEQDKANSDAILQMNADYIELEEKHKQLLEERERDHMNGGNNNLAQGIDELKELQKKYETQKTNYQDLLHKDEERQEEWNELQKKYETLKTNYQDLHRKYEEQEKANSDFTLQMVSTNEKPVDDKADEILIRQMLVEAKKKPEFQKFLMAFRNELDAKAAEFAQIFLQGHIKKSP